VPRLRSWQPCPNNPPCEHGELLHEKGICIEHCDCGSPAHWLTPDRKAQLRQGAAPQDDYERLFQQTFYEDRARRLEAMARRG
jgi:hypothetical protein